jgi:Flp pilus assembly protein TadG
MSTDAIDATIPAMDMTAGPLSRPGKWIREGMRRTAARAARRTAAARGRSERGAVLIEFAIIFPLLITITFGIVEYAGAYHDSAVAADAVRAGGRVGSALGTNPAYTTSVTDAVSAALLTLPADEPQELWIYKANTKGYPGSSTDFSLCATNCIKYTWNQALKAWNTGTPQGSGWPASTHQVCTTPYDELGVYLKMHHRFVTGFFGAGVTLQDHSVFRFEPVPTSICAP